MKFKVDKNKLNKIKSVYPKSYKLLNETLNGIKNAAKQNKKNIDKKELDKSFKKIINVITKEAKSPPARKLVKSNPKAMALVRNLDKNSTESDSSRPLDNEDSITKISFAFGILMLNAVINTFMTDILITLTENAARGMYIAIAIVAPLNEEAGRIICEGMFKNGAIYYSAVISTYELFQRFKSYGVSTRLFLTRVLSSGIHFLNGFIQKLLIKKFGIKGGVVAYFITVVIHALWNGGGGFKVMKLVKLTTKEDEEGYKRFTKMVRGEK